MQSCNVAKVGNKTTATVMYADNGEKLPLLKTTMQLTGLE
jgi:hypothetical protein